MRDGTEQIDISDNYSVIVDVNLRKWRDTGYVQSFDMDVGTAYTRLSVRFTRDIDAIERMDVAGRTLMLDFTERTLSAVWTDRSGQTWRNVISGAAATRSALEAMIVYLNSPMGALVEIVHDRMPDAERVAASHAGDMRRLDHVSLRGEAVGRILSHPDVADLVVARVGGGMRLDVKLGDRSALKVAEGPIGGRMVSFLVSPEETILSWRAGMGREEERRWSGRDGVNARVLADPMAAAVEAVMGEKDADRRGKAVNPVWRLIRHIEDAVENRAFAGNVPLSAV